jgi:hypothetical protein
LAPPNFIPHSRLEDLPVLLRFTALIILSAGASVARAQTTAAPPPARLLTVAQQIAVAVTPLPKEFRDSATVLGYGADGKLQQLREGSGAMVCLAPDPARERIQAACYHRSLEAFMARGRQLRAEGLKADQVDSVRFAEVSSGRLGFPLHPALLYSITGDAGSYDAATGTIKGRSLFVVYVKNATAATTGLPAQPTPGMPWIMHPGTVKAHIMFVPTM